MEAPRGRLTRLREREGGLRVARVGPRDGERRRRLVVEGAPDRDDHVGRVVSSAEEDEQELLARWIEEGRQLFNIWQERVERFDQLQGRLAAMAQETGQLSSRIDGLRAENLHLSQQGEALLLERDQLRSILARIAGMIQRAGKGRPRPHGAAT